MANRIGDTDLFPGGRQFPSTCWTLFLGNPGDPNGRAALERLAQDYWAPVYAYIRSRWTKSNEDAKDLTQAFFLWMLETEFVSRADPSRGRFRAFLKVALDHFLMKDARDRAALKRGGGNAIVRIDLEEAAALLPKDETESPARAMDLAWRNMLLSRAAEALEKSLRGDDKAVYFEIFRAFHWADDQRPSYRDLAARHGVTETDVSNHLMEAKRRFRAILTGLVAETVQSEGDLREELESLFGADFA